MVQVLPALGFSSKGLQRAAGPEGPQTTVVHIKSPLLLNKHAKGAPQAISHRPRPSQSQNKRARIIQTCKLFDQPTEIILLISKFLNNPSRAAFSLSCKTAYTLVGPAPGEKFRLKTMERTALLQLMERDPTVGDHLYYCDRCIILHPFEERWTKPPVLMLLDRDLCSTWNLHPMGNSLRVEYCHARLVMNRHFYGAPNGLPVESLTSKATNSRSSAELIQSRTARIINDQLYIRSEHRVVPKTATVDPDTFYRCLYIFSLNICHHQETDHVHTISPEVLRFAAKTRPSMLNPLASSTRQSSSQGSCKRCPTDYETTVQLERGVHKSGQQTLTATVVSYQLLGRCRSTPDPSAYSLFNVGKSRAMENFYWRDLKDCPAGSVQERWKSLDDIQRD
ncbi:unnamed protein product [Clonostachys byssicola]|uniref:F-box domain-containing protein n=1 Tax=Clonostachys byssicola TaxID=160290 RepID=A0A9N9U3J0_9HYPO|nr:unnamed protein product [Clonostachys byssicola]